MADKREEKFKVSASIVGLVGILKRQFLLDGPFLKMDFSTRIWAFLLALVVSLSASSAVAEQRLALVVGIDKYENVTSLLKAGNDANAVSDVLGEVGFSVTKLIDPSRRTLNREIARFSASIRPGDIVVFFFAGHGIEIDGRNYLLPADVPAAQAGDEQFVASESIAADQLSSVFQSQGARVTFLILDACRNNPFPSAGTRSMGGQQGLARMDPAEGAFVLFSAGTGQTALDRLSNSDPDPNSVFTRVLLPRLLQPGLTVLDLVQEVRLDVRSLASSVNHNQFPAYYDQLSGSFTFNPEPAEQSQSQAIQTTPAIASPARSTCDTAREDWAVLQNTQSVQALEQFSEAYTECAIYVAAAQDRLASLATPQVPEPRLQSSAVSSANSCEELWYARNLIFHQKGFCFQTARAQTAFDTSNCTTRSPALTTAEKSEVDRIRALERASGC